MGWAERVSAGIGKATPLGGLLEGLGGPLVAFALLRVGGSWMRLGCSKIFIGDFFRGAVKSTVESTVKKTVKKTVKRS